MSNKLKLEVELDSDYDSKYKQYQAMSACLSDIRTSLMEEKASGIISHIVDKVGHEAEWEVSDED